MFTMIHGNKYYAPEKALDRGTALARSMLLEVMDNATEKRVKKSEISKEIQKALKVKGEKRVLVKEINAIIELLCIPDPNNKAFHILK